MSTKNNNIPKLKYYNGILPNSIEKFFDEDKSKRLYNTQIKHRGLNAFTTEYHLRRFQSLDIDRDLRCELMETYILGFRKGYYNYQDGTFFEIFTDAIGINFPFVSNSMFGLDHFSDRFESFDQGFENGKKYRAMEMIIKNPFNYNEFFDHLLKKYPNQYRLANFSGPEIALYAYYMKEARISFTSSVFPSENAYKELSDQFKKNWKNIQKYYLEISRDKDSRLKKIKSTSFNKLENLLPEKAKTLFKTEISILNIP